MKNFNHKFSGIFFTDAQWFVISEFFRLHIAVPGYKAKVPTLVLKFLNQDNGLELGKFSHVFWDVSQNQWDSYRSIFIE